MRRLVNNLQIYKKHVEQMQVSINTKKVEADRRVWYVPHHSFIKDKKKQ